MSPDVEIADRTTVADRRALGMPLATVARVDLTPLAASDAVGRYSGIESLTARTPLWRSAGIVGLVALVAAGAAPVIAGVLLSG
ncbi:hypothetical protein [Microbacterium sp. NPDC087665]|uniref:hypothetical protein n=1 Tax=Microbacterium sp. NPDC087665 TaxID=3364194 RepID=UPI00380CE200